MDKLTGDIQRFSAPSPSNASVAYGGPGVDEVRAFLSGHHSEAISELELLHGGFWSAAYGYRVDGRDLVLRIGQMRAGFEMDRDAMAYNASDLPVPEVLEIGDVFRGDFLFDTAWCSFWGTFHPGIAAADVFRRVVRDVSIARDPAALDNAAERHHCYELHVGATHLGWNAWIGDEEALRAVATRTEAILERGPLSMKDR